jgi:predicted GIY-YIG superfamily endonuclease
VFYLDEKNKMTGGFVYVGESTRPDGSKQIYTGMTTRNPRTRWTEHIKAVRDGNGSSWVGRGTFFNPIGAIYSSNPRKAERTIKAMSSSQKRSFGYYCARKYHERK